MGVNSLRIENLSERLIEYLARISVGMHVSSEELQIITGSSLLKITQETLAVLSKEVIKNKNNILFCNICGKGPFTKRGAYLHLMRMHKYEMKTLILQELREKISKITNSRQ